MTNDKAILQLISLKEYLDKNIPLSTADESIDMAIQALRAEQNGGWISVKDRLPEEHGEYLTLCETPNGDFTVKLSTLFPYEGNLYWSDYAMERVAYWQPLPNLPKGEEA